MTPIIYVEGPISREDDWNRTLFEFHVTYESGTVRRWLLEFSHHKRTFRILPCGSSDLAPVFPKMVLALGHRPIDMPDGGLCDHLRSLLPSADLAACLAAALSE